jgi:uncharacterized protein with GYD domain
VSYTVEGTKGVLKDGAAKRRQVVKDLVEGLGGKLELFDYALGETDLFSVVELPDNATAAGVSMVICAGGGATIKTTVLLSPEEIDRAPLVETPKLTS